MTKEFDRWNEKKKALDRTEFDDYVHEREVWWCALGLNVGVEADGKNDDFDRPVLVLRKFNRDSVLIVPLSSRIKDNPYHVKFQHEGETAAAVASCTLKCDNFRSYLVRVRSLFTHRVSHRRTQPWYNKRICVCV